MFAAETGCPSLASYPLEAKTSQSFHQLYVSQVDEHDVQTPVLLLKARRVYFPAPASPTDHRLLPHLCLASLILSAACAWGSSCFPSFRWFEQHLSGQSSMGVLKAESIDLTMGWWFGLVA